MIKPQTKVGLLLLAAFAIGIMVIINLGDVRFRGYEFYILFDDLADLPAKPLVKISGVDVGRVSRVELYKGRARIKVWLESDVKIHKDAQAKILKMGMIGNTYVSLTKGSADKPLIHEGDTIEGVNPLSYEEVMDSLVNGIDKVVGVFRDLGGDGSLGSSLNGIISDLRNVSSGLRNILGSNGEKLSAAIDNIDTAAVGFDNFVKSEGSKFGDGMEEIGRAASELQKLLQNLNEGKGGIGKIISDKKYSEKIGGTIDSIYDASIDLKQAVNRVKGFDTILDADVYYEPTEEQYRSYVGMSVKTSSKRYLSISLDNINGSGGKPSDLDQGGDRINSLTVKAGKTFGPFTVYGGAIRSSGGFGADWLYKNKLTVGTEMFDFTRSQPWLRLSSKLKLTEFLKFGVSYEDVLQDGSFRAGMEVDIE